MSSGKVSERTQLHYPLDGDTELQLERERAAGLIYFSIRDFLSLVVYVYVTQYTF